MEERSELQHTHLVCLGEERQEASRRSPGQSTIDTDAVELGSRRGAEQLKRVERAEALRCPAWSWQGPVLRSGAVPPSVHLQFLHRLAAHHECPHSLVSLLVVRFVVQASLGVNFLKPNVDQCTGERCGQQGHGTEDGHEED